MLTLGIHTKEQYLKLGAQRRFSGARVAYNLLRTGDDPSPEEVRVFEDICVTLRTSNGTFRTTFRNRFDDVNRVAEACIRSAFPNGGRLRVQDRAVSSGLTSFEWAQGLFTVYPEADFEASDRLLELQELTSPGGEAFIREPGGPPLQYIGPPFVVSLDAPESWRNPFLRWVASRARQRFAKLPPDCPVRPISCIHPEAVRFSKTHPGFYFRVRSVFDRTPGACDVLRTMNILNLSYFSRAQLSEAAAAVFDSLAPGGIWIVGRTTEDDFTNHATIFRRSDSGWTVLERVGSGSEIEDLALGAPVAA